MVHIIAERICGTTFVPDLMRDYATWQYLHGMLQDRVGYDKFSYLLDNRPAEDGVYQAKVFVSPTEVVDSVLYLWTITDYRGRQRERGLVVAWNDQEGNEYATECFLEKREEL